MGTGFLTLGVVMLLAAMLPGADFAIVTKNSILHSRKAGIYTALGIGAATWVHIIYSILGLAIIIRESSWIFHTIQYAGALYLVYLGIMLIKSNASQSIELTTDVVAMAPFPNGTAFLQGFICNLLNPKAPLFFITLFSTVATTQPSLMISFLYAIEMFAIAMLWFCSLVCLISHKAVVPWLNKSKVAIEKLLGVLLLGLAIFVVFFV